MFTFLTAAPNMPFVVAIAVMLLIVVLEVVSVGLGAGFSDVIDSFIPEFDADIDVDAGIDIPDTSPATIASVLSWFRVGEVPILMLFIVFLTIFGLSGLILQSIVQGVTGKLLAPFITVVPVCFISLPAVRVLGGLMGKYMPKDETYIVSEKTLLGRIATIIAGTAKTGNPTQAKVRDEYGKAHYILVEPDKLDEVFGTGEKVILVSQSGAIFKAIENHSSALIDN